MSAYLGNGPYKCDCCGVEYDIIFCDPDIYDIPNANPKFATFNKCKDCGGKDIGNHWKCPVCNESYKLHGGPPSSGGPLSAFTCEAAERMMRKREANCCFDTWWNGVIPIDKHTWKWESNENRT